MKSFVAFIVALAFSTFAFAHDHSKPSPTPTPAPVVTSTTDQGDDFHDTQRAVRGVLITGLVVCGLEMLHHRYNEHGAWRLCFTKDKPAQRTDAGSIVPANANPRIHTEVTFDGKR